MYLRCVVPQEQQLASPPDNVIKPTRTHLKFDLPARHSGPIQGTHTLLCAGAAFKTITTNKPLTRTPSPTFVCRRLLSMIYELSDFFQYDLRIEEIWYGRKP